MASLLLHECDHTVAGRFVETGSTFQARSETEATEELRVGAVELRITESGCTHFGLTLEFRARGRRLKPGQAAKLLQALPLTERGKPPLEMLRGVLRRTKPSMLGKPQARDDGGTVTVSVTADSLTVGYDFPM